MGFVQLSNRIKVLGLLVSNHLNVQIKCSFNSNMPLAGAKGWCKLFHFCIVSAQSRLQTSYNLTILLIYFF